ncbi:MULTISPECIES: PPC domain-containing DNA-binding protein [unclassified Streptomyces]|uniref:DNA-binding protein n=1 Tax=Streptomyces sp. NBC_00060 TaxID=2975636 RepID=A0AAU2GXB3_9ACTN
MKTHAFRLLNGDDLKKSIESYVTAQEIQAGYVITCVGGFSGAVLRMPGAKTFEHLEGDYEIVSIEGTLSPNGCHIHVSMSDIHGNVKGGHLSEGCIVRLTAEVVLAEDRQFRFYRRFDQDTGFNELGIESAENSF